MRNSKGFSLLETVIGIAIIAVVGIGLVAGLGTTFKMLSITNDRQHAKTLAAAEMEYVQGVPYSTSGTGYSDYVIPAEYAGYIVAPIIPEAIPPADVNAIQKITIVVTHPFGQITLIDYKVNVNR